MELIPRFSVYCESIALGHNGDEGSPGRWFEEGLRRAVDQLRLLEGEGGAPESPEDALELLLFAWVAANEDLDARAYAAWRSVGTIDLGLDLAEQIVPIENRVARAIVLFHGAEKGPTKVPITKRQALKIAGVTLVGAGVMAAGGAVAAPIVGSALAATSAAASTGAFLMSTPGIAAVAGLFGAYGANRTAWKMIKREGGLKEFFWLPAERPPGSAKVEHEKARDDDDELTLSKQHLHCVVGVSGWLLSEKATDIASSWATSLQSFTGSTKYALMFDRQHLVEYGAALRRFVFDQAVENLVLHAGALVAGPTVLLATAPPSMAMLLQDVVDSPFAVAKNKAKLAGKELARAISSRAFGHRPVSLVGFGFGATTILQCLETLASELDGKDRRGYVHDVFLFAAPIKVSPERWKHAAKCVAGRFVNHYCRSDYVLMLLLRLSTKRFPSAGVEPVEGIVGLENRMVKVTSYQIGSNPALINEFLHESFNNNNEPPRSAN